MPQLVAAIGAIGSAFTATGIGSFLTTTVVGKLLTSVALSALSRALQSRPSNAPPGIKTSATQAGGTNPGQFILGRYATGGAAVSPAMSHGSVSGVGHNVYLTYVIEVSDLPVQGLAGLIIDGTVAEIGTTPHADYGLPILGDFLDRAWVKFYTGTQTAADPMLLAKYADYPDRPWTADMIGDDLAYAIVTFRYDREVFDSLPTVRFIVDGLKLYDPRKDTTVGGSGAHRWATPSTWEWTQNPVVMIYNIMRGITLPDGKAWGGGFAAADLPFANWVAAMNACDVTVTEGGASVPLYRAGLDVAFNDEPAGVIEELLLACNGQMVDMGGTWKIRAGGPGLPVLFYDDDAVMASRPEDFDPFPAVVDTYNGITATYPAPGALWEPKEATPIYNTEFEAADGGRRLVANLQFRAVTSHRQARHIMRSTLRDHRRMRRHNNTLGPFAMAVEPLDVVAWTSARNGYAEKSFEVGQVVDGLSGMPLPQLALREVDASDYVPSEFDDTVVSLPPGKVVRPGPRLLSLFAVTGVSIDDEDAKPRRPALRLTWSTAALEDVDGIEFEVRRTGTTEAFHQGTIRNVEGGLRIVTGGILPGRSYQARARLVVNRPRAWTSWITAVAPETRLGGDDLDEDVNTSEAGNVFKDFDCLRPGMWFSPSGTSAYSFVTTSAAKLGQKRLNIAFNAAARNVYTRWFRVEPGVEYLAEGAAWINEGFNATCQIYFESAAIDAAGVVDEAGAQSLLVKSTVNQAYSSVNSHGSVTVTPRATDRVGRFRVLRVVGGTSSVAAGGLRLQRKARTDLIGNAQVVTMSIQPNAVTIPVSTYSGGGVVVSSLVTPVELAVATIPREAGFITRVGLAFLLRPVDGTAAGTTASVNVSIRRDGVEIINFDCAALSIDSTSSPPIPVSYFFWDLSAAGGTATYSAVALKSPASGANAAINRRSIELEQKKR